MLRDVLCLVIVLLFASARGAEAVRTAPLRAATSEEVMLLNESLQKTATDLRRWAFTESRVIHDEKGRVKSDLVLRYDPSKPYPEQWTPITINGKPPTARDLEKYRKIGERARKRDENPSTDNRPSLGELIDLRGAQLMSETPQQLVFQVPLRKDRNDRFPPEKFEVLVRIDRESHGVENIAVRLRSSFRSKLIINIKSGGGTMDFAIVNPKYPPTLTAIAGDATASVFFISIGGELALKRTDFKHVKPFDERFEVQIGTLKAIDF